MIAENGRLEPRNADSGRRNRRLAAVLSADAVGFTRLMAEDPDATVDAITSHRELIAQAIGRHGGRVVDTPGDNVLAELPSALDSVRAAVEIQGELTGQNADLPPERRMLFRIGIHVGDVTGDETHIYGDGVNIAARLQALARSGGICVSAEVYGLVRNNLELLCEDLGEQRIKNLPGPVHVYRIQVEGEEKGVATGVDRFTGQQGSRPAIAVLPFDNLCEEPDQDYFADGLCDELITRLSRRRDFPVIARNSSFVYRGRSVAIEQVGRELRARYVLEGSVRRARGRIRINAQLIDASTQHHVWAQHFDGSLEDIFELQDQITEAIAVAMHPELLRSESERAILRDPTQVGAWDVAVRGLWHFKRQTRQDNERARRHFDDAIKADPGFVLPVYYRALSRYAEFFERWTDAPLAQVREEIRREGELCISIDQCDPLGYVLVALSSMLVPDHARAIASLRTALEWDPSLPRAHSFMGQFLALGGDPARGIAEVEEAIRLSPRDPELDSFYSSLTLANFIGANYEAAVHWAEMSLRLKPTGWVNYTAIASANALLGRHAEAELAAKKLLAEKPDFSIEQSRWVLVGAQPADYERFKQGLIRAGFPAGA